MLDIGSESDAEVRYIHVGLAGGAHGGGVAREEFSKGLIRGALEVATVAAHEFDRDRRFGVVAEGMH